MCKVGDGLSRPVLIARKTFVEGKKNTPNERFPIEVGNDEVFCWTSSLFSQVIYCRGYSGEEPPLPIPNREVKLTRADGPDLPVGRVSRRGFLEAPIEQSTGASFVVILNNK